MNPKERLEQIKKELIIVLAVSFPAVLIFSVGLYAKFVTNGDAFLPILNDELIVNIMLVVGASLMAWTSYKTFALAREKQTLIREHDL